MMMINDDYDWQLADIWIHHMIDRWWIMIDDWWMMIDDGWKMIDAGW